MELDVCGQIPPDWDVMSIEDVCVRVTSGGTPSRARPDYYCDGTWGWVKTQELRDAWIDQTEERITDDAVQKSSAKVLPANTVLLALYGATVGQLGILRRPMTCNQACCAMIVDPRKADFRYVYHQLRLARPQLRTLATGAAQQNLSGALMKSLRLPLPPLAEQKRIAHILGTLDDKIELNRRMNATLESISRALFKSWFVDFDPVRQKAAGKQPVGMDAKTAALFPDSFEESAIGEVPKGWRVDAFADHFDADRGLSYKGEGLREDGSGVPMHNLNSIYEGGGYKHEGIKYYAGEYRDKHLISPGDVIVTNTEQGFDQLLIGHAAVVPKCFGPTGIYSHHIYRVRCKASSPLTPGYVVSLLNDPRWHYWISGFSNGTTINMLPLDALQMPLLVVPPSRLVQAFDHLATAAHERCEANLQESSRLAALRDALLPKLLSGEVRVPEVEQAVEDAIG
jgi:type I restriction enzyme S subunit